MAIPICDLHCDLLCYLEGKPTHNAFNHEPRCSIPHLHEGGVMLQTMAIFAEAGPRTLERGLAQFEIFYRLPILYPEHFTHVKNPQEQKGKINLLHAFEGASTFCNETESIEQGLNRLDQLTQRAKPLYISLTWNEENRFGGGAHTTVGLKEDGKRLLDFMNGKGIAADLSHTSDALAWDILNYIDQKNLKIPVIASHSNFRAIQNAPRNLTDDLAKEIWNRKGIIGLNFYKKFVGENTIDFTRHLEHALNLGGENQIVFGADFFHEDNLPADYRQGENELFFSEFGNSGCYPKMIDLFKNELKISNEQAEKIAHKNFHSWWTLNCIQNSR